MSWIATNLTRIHCTGDSITSLATGVLGNYPGVAGGLIDQIRSVPLRFSPYPSSLLVPARVGQVIPASYIARQQQGRRQVVTVYGVGGRVIAGLASTLQESIYSFAPDLIVIELGTNDFGGATDVSPGGAFQTSYATVLDGIRTNLPAAKVLCLSIPVRGEVVVAGPHFSDGTDTWAGNTRIIELCNGTSTVGTFRATYPQFCEYVDIITPALSFSAIYNPIGSSSTPRYLTQDSLHPTALGKVLIGTVVMQHLTFS